MRDDAGLTRKGWKCIQASQTRLTSLIRNDDVGFSTPFHRACPNNENVGVKGATGIFNGI